MLLLGHVAAGCPVDKLRLEHDNGIGVTDRRREQALGVGGRRRHDDLHARRVDVVRLGRVVVELGRAHATAVRHAHDERERHRAARPPAVSADVGDQLVEAGVAERVVLHLTDRAPAGHAQPDCRAEEPGLGERGIDAALRPEAVEQPGGRAEDPARATNVLPQEEHVRVAVELDMKRVVDRLHQGQLPGPHLGRAHNACT